MIEVCATYLFPVLVKLYTKQILFAPAGANNIESILFNQEPYHKLC